jgi:hypothetical protein
MEKKKEWCWIASFDMPKDLLDSLNVDYSEGYFIYGGDLYVIMDLQEKLIQGRRFRHDDDLPNMRR